MDTPSAYIPIDWRHALAQGKELPERAVGAALFADISGFTPLTEALALELGARRGAEELTVHLNRVYGALIDVLHRYGGSVIGFSGDAMTCWLSPHGDAPTADATARAVASALAMQAGMQQFSQVRTRSGRVIELGIKVAVATGAARRFVVGDPSYRRLDVLAGTTLERLADAEGQAERGDVVIDRVSAEILAPDLTISDWRNTDFAVVTQLNRQVAETPWPALPPDALDAATHSAWLLPPVYQRLASGLGEFLAELRNAFAMLLRFSGIDYEGDADAPAKLDRFIRGVQAILTRYDGSLIQLTVGDKGSYMYIAFGAPITHENDAIRAAACVLEIQALAARLDYLEPLQAGLTLGRMRTGAYGSETRRTYGALGDAVNLAARLMMAAKPGQILVSEAARREIGAQFIFEQMPNITVKGKRKPVALAQLVGKMQRRGLGMLEPQYQLPMVGRTTELALTEAQIAEVLSGRGQVIGITAEAGMGKSRLSAEIIQAALSAGLNGMAGECQSYGTITSYLPWQGVWRAFFGVDPTLQPEAQIAILEDALTKLDPSLMPRLPLLGAVLNLSIPENDLTKSLDAKVRKSSLEDLLLQCVQRRAQIEPLLIVLEDCHWLDDLSRDLIGVIASAIGELPVLMLIVYRPPDEARKQAPPVDQLPYFNEIVLGEFSAEETRTLVALKLQQFYGADTEVPSALLQRITQRTAGNPFYIEEVLNYLRDLGVDPQNIAALDAIELPNSIHALVLSRIDQLNESQQITMKVASVIGRLFQAAMVWGVYPDLHFEEVQENLDLLSRVHLTPQEPSEVELTYLFKHIVTQQVAYESLLFATRSVLHEQIGQFIENRYADTLDQFTGLLAFHFEHSENVEKQRFYFMKAGQAAKRDYANTAAISYFQKLLLLLEGREQIDVHLELGKVYQFISAWEDSAEQFTTALNLSIELGDESARAWSETAHGELARRRNDYAAANDWFEQAQARFTTIDEKAGIGQVLHYAGTVAAQSGDLPLANQRYNQSVAIRRELGDRENEANVLNNLGIVSRYLGNTDAALHYHQASLDIQEALGQRWSTASILNNIGQLVIVSGQLAHARELLNRALAIYRDIGDRWSTTNTLHNLATVVRDEGDRTAAQRLFSDSIAGWRELDDRWGTAYWIEDVAVFLVKEDPARAMRLIGAAATLRDAINSPRPPAEQTQLEQQLITDSLDAAAREAAIASGRTLSIEEAIALAGFPL